VAREWLERDDDLWAETSSWPTPTEAEWPDVRATLTGRTFEAILVECSHSVGTTPAHAALCERDNSALVSAQGLSLALDAAGAGRLVSRSWDAERGEVEYSLNAVRLWLCKSSGRMLLTEDTHRYWRF
jgi:hypothetical protein